MPVPASKSRNISTNERTNLAALALLIRLKKGLVALISSPNSITDHKFGFREILFFYIHILKLSKEN
jgi:hypothetical protein